MDVRIGMLQTPKELVVELADDADRAELKTQVTAALAGEIPVLWLTDAKGREYAVATERLSYVELGASDAERRFGFGAG